MDEFAGSNPIYRFGEFELEAGRRILRTCPANEVVTLTPRAFDLLLEFLRRPQEPIAKAQLMEALWPEYVVEDNNLDRAVSTLRRALGDHDGEHRYIKTIHRRGYQFTMPVSIVTGAAARAALEQPVDGAPQPKREPTHIALGIGIALVLATALAIFAPWNTNTRSASPAVAASAGSGMLAVRFFGCEGDDESQSLAGALTTLLEQRFSAIPGLAVLAPGAAWSARNVEESAAAFGARMHAKFVLGGEAARSGPQLHLSVTLTDATRDRVLWSQEFDRPIADVGAVREEITAHVADALGIAPQAGAPAAQAPVDLDVHQLYWQAERLMTAGASPADARKAIALFTRTTALDPRFARGYLGIGRALIYGYDLQPPTLSAVARSEVGVQALAAIDRALELDPALGEAWVAKARLVSDPEQAARMYRRGLQLKPNYTEGAMYFSDFLMGGFRAADAIDVLEGARRFEPGAPLLLWLQAEALMAARSDVDGSERLLRKVLEMDGGKDIATVPLALLLQHQRGRFAEAMRLFQDRPASTFVRASMALLYLDMDELQAAMDVWNAADPPPGFQLMLVSQYRRDPSQAAQLARALFAASRADMYGMAAPAIRDEAVATGDYAAAIAVLEPAHASRPGPDAPVALDYNFSIAFAHVLILSGQRERGRSLARSVLVRLDADEIGRPAHWFARQRAQLFAMLGEDDEALDELAADQRLNHWSRWWYTGEVDPVFAHLHGDPRFVALVASARRQRAAQRALYQQMIRRGDVRVSETERGK